MLHAAAQLARSRRERGLRLNQPEAVAVLSSWVLEAARDGRSVADLMQQGRHVLTTDDVIDGVAALVPEVQIEATFPDGTKLVTLHTPILPPVGTSADEPPFVPGEIVGPDPGVDDEIELNVGLPVLTLRVENTGDRPVQVGSHYHFAESNPALSFDREAARGHRLDVPAGTAVRFEPGVVTEVDLVPFTGARIVAGLRGEVAGPLDHRTGESGVDE